VVGGRLAGLAAASRAGGRRGRGGGAGGPRPGRRAHPDPAPADGTPIDHGGQWIGPTQDRIAALAERVGVTTYPSYERGLNTEFPRRAGPTAIDGAAARRRRPGERGRLGQAIR
jgi:monoamine oxidase